MPCVDFTRIQETSDGDFEFEAELIEMYLEDAREHKDRIVALIGDEDLQSIKQTAHTLKGSSANIGATSMQEVAADIEKCAAAESADFGELGQQLEGIFSDTESEFREYIDSHS